MKMTTADLFAAPSTITVVPKSKKSVNFVKAVGEDDNAYQALSKSLMSLDGEEDKNPERLAFEIDPITNRSVFASLYRPKQKGLSDTILKRLSVQASIVASIVNARGNQVSAFGRPQPDRFSTGYKIEPNPTVVDKLSQEEKEDLQKRIVKAESLIATCGKPYDANECKDLSFSQYLFMTTRNALIFGRIATEAIPDGDDKFHSFRPIDAGTIYFSMAQKDAADNVRRQAQNLLAQLKLEKPSSFIDSKGRNVDELFGEDEYAWVQVISDRPVQFFTAKECLVHNFYPVTDVEQVGYPLTPLDTIVSDVTTFINITTHNRLFFQSGRASRGAVVLQSDDIDDIDLQHIRQQFQANINGVGNSWRTPMFKVGKDDKVDWFSIDSNARDMEFQYLSDSNARTILSGFQVSPEELSGYSHLSKGTNSQALSEANNEYQLEAHRDTGIRPLLWQMQSFINQRILPLIDAELAKICTFKFVGLDAETAEKETTRLQTDATVHMTYDQILQKVEKKPLGAKWGGTFPLNPAFQQILDRYMTVGQILEGFFGVAGAGEDPRLDYRRDEYWFRQVDVLNQKQQLDQQAQMQAQQQAQGGQPGQPAQPGQAPSGPQGDQQAAPQPAPDQAANASQQPAQPQQDPNQPDLSTGIDQLAGILNKSESQLPTSKRHLLAQQRLFISHAMSALEEESKKAIKEISGIAKKHIAPTK